MTNLGPVERGRTTSGVKNVTREWACSRLAQWWTNQTEGPQNTTADKTQMATGVGFSCDPPNIGNNRTTSAQQVSRIRSGAAQPQDGGSGRKPSTDCQSAGSAGSPDRGHMLAPSPRDACPLDPDTTAQLPVQKTSHPLASDQDKGRSITQMAHWGSVPAGAQGPHQARATGGPARPHLHVASRPLPSGQVPARLPQLPREGPWP